MSPILINGVTGAVVMAALTLAHFGIIPGDVAYTIAGGGLYYLTGQTYTFAARSVLKSVGVDTRISGSLGAHLAVSTGVTGDTPHALVALPVVNSANATPPERPTAKGAIDTEATSPLGGIPDLGT